MGVPLKSHDQELLAFAHGLALNDLPAGAVDNAKACLLDALGWGIFGSGQIWSPILADEMLAEGTAIASERGGAVYGASNAIRRDMVAIGANAVSVRRRPDFKWRPTANVGLGACLSSIFKGWTGVDADRRALSFLRAWRRGHRLLKMQPHFGGGLAQIVCCDRLDNLDVLAAPVLDAATVEIAAEFQ